MVMSKSSSKRVETLRFMMATEQRLLGWRENFEERDALVRQAVADGVTKQRIHELTGLARTTIDYILADKTDES